MSNEESENKKHLKKITAEIPIEHYNELKKLANEDCRTVSGYLRYRLLQHLIEKRENQ